MKLGAQVTLRLPKGVLNYLTAFYISSHGFCCPLTSHGTKKPVLPGEKIRTQRLDNTFVSDIEMNQTAEFECECIRFDAKELKSSEKEFPPTPNLPSLLAE